VVIGRNEGERLARCLSSVQGDADAVVYVDSGSTDDSLARARAAGARIVELDMSRPFTAARARNAGAAELAEIAPAVEHVHFIDGDCEILPGWIDAARAFLRDHPEVAVVSGRLRERFPEATVYNRLCDREWSAPAGEARSCGGIALMRRDAFAAAGGFRPDLIAGEEPELCVRLRRDGWRVWRIDADMALHDAAMTRFGQWWTRARRAGHAFAEGAALHGAPPERHGVAGATRALAWGAALPLATLLLLAVTPWAALLLLAYPLQVLRLAVREGPRRRASWEHALFTTLGKFAEAQGALGYWRGRLLGRKGALIEYK
jgi:GT2 family glycosyltransferase